LVLYCPQMAWLWTTCHILGHHEPSLCCYRLCESSFYMMSGSFTGKEPPGRDADFSPLLVPWSRKGRAVVCFLVGNSRRLNFIRRRFGTFWPFHLQRQVGVQLYLYSPIGRTACTQPQCCTRVHFTFTME
jgi:hypothetical protein